MYCIQYSISVYIYIFFFKYLNKLMLLDKKSKSKRQKYPNIVLHILCIEMKNYDNFYTYIYQIGI